MANLELKNVHKSYGAVEVLKDINLSIRDGEFVVFVGPSGCGKSTLLRMIAGLEDITSGELRIDGALSNKLTPKQRNIAMVFQSYALYPQMTVAENMGFSLSLEKTPKAEISRKVMAAAEALKLEPLLERKPGQLSGGQRQRVAIGRAIVRSPRLFLLDEPLSNLDAALRSETRVEISELHQRLATTMIYVTHDQVEAMTMADRIVVLNGGRIEQVGSPMELYNNPASEFVASFIGSPKMNLISGGAARAFGAETVGIRPEHMIINVDDPTWQAKVTLVERLGHNTIVYARVPEIGLFTVSLDGQHDFDLGATVGLAPRVDRIHRFDAAGAPIGR
ncbi:ABC transporter ATP-binding protein [Limimaricola pyoseonensis]|uniref:Carbohydrate ABC transporter ATP-binding protein, CUT1 family n=1 Tax=Limimaricola pyoseonensis TaxID=521013 RepID=A0A1G7CEE7_9RHOB|nr:ABC transporter ATP-binding protein [Limimaricola pyoseonensis]SDE37066.1 carbohydrate ABC transporter ATP-binding protein, CUT1 family [Limimaricola pyoseonensis]